MSVNNLMNNISHLLDSKQKYFYTFQTLDDKNLKVVSFTLEEEISQPFVAEIVVASKKYYLDPSDYLDFNGLLRYIEKGKFSGIFMGLLLLLPREIVKINIISIPLR